MTPSDPTGGVRLRLTVCLSVAALLVSVLSCEDTSHYGRPYDLDRTALSGSYRTTDQRLPNASIELMSDGRFKSFGVDGLPGEGTFEATWTYTGWDISFQNTPGNAGMYLSGGHRIRGTKPPYRLEVFLPGDPDHVPPAWFDKSR